MTWNIAFDADDTLWHNEHLYALTQKQFYELLLPYADQDNLHQRLLDTERRNLQIYGYGVKSFTLSMIETALEVSAGKVEAAAIRQILDFGRDMLTHQIELLPEVRATLEVLGARHNLLLITKGDLFHQESRIAMSGLGELFSAVEVVSEKDPSSYSKIFQRYHLRPGSFIMVGNSVRSDILPVLELGARAIYIPYEVTWEHEQGDLTGVAPGRWYEASSIAEVPAIVQRFGTPG